MRIYDPRNQYGHKLLTDQQTIKTSILLDKSIDASGSVTITESDLEDIEEWTVSSVTVTIPVEGEVSFQPGVKRGDDGELILQFLPDGGTRTPDFDKAVIVLQRMAFDGMKQAVTIEMKIAALMAKTLADSKKPDYDASANIDDWKALGVEAKTKEAANYPYADCSTAAELSAAGLNPSTATAIGSDICLISLDTVNNEGEGNPSFPKVQTFEADLPSLKNGSYMFQDQTKIQSFTGKFPNLTNAEAMFAYCERLSSWTVDLPATLTETDYMFMGCSGLTSFAGNLPATLTEADYMFENCTGLTSWNVELPAGLQSAEGMFGGCTGLTSWNVELPANLTNAIYMFMGCTGLTEWTVNLPDSLTNALSMFAECEGLTSFAGDLPEGLTDANSMFENCTGLTSWTVALPEGLTNTTSMFLGCTGLTSWTIDLSAVNDSTSMFLGCTGLTSFNADLSLLTIGYYMFNDCTSLTSFNAGTNGLKSLYNGDCMFQGCNLDETSVLHILNTIPHVSGQYYKLHLGKRTNFLDSSDIATLLGTTAPIAAASNYSYKGWKITITN